MDEIIRKIEELNRQSEVLQLKMLAALADGMRTLDRDNWMNEFSAISRRRDCGEAG